MRILLATAVLSCFLLVGFLIDDAHAAVTTTPAPTPARTATPTPTPAPPPGPIKASDVLKPPPPPLPPDWNKPAAKAAPPPAAPGKPPAVITGKVADEKSGQPVANARVFYWTASEQYSVASVVTDKDGNYATPKIAA